MKTESRVEVKEEIKGEPEVDGQPAISQGFEEQKPTGIKKEPSDEDISASIPQLDPGVKQEGGEPAAPGVVFKKRKAKNIRQK
jgi:hypothetical protein